jgi:hypothetical protein
MYLYRTEPVSHIGDVQGKGKGKGNEGGGGPANNPCDYIRCVRKWLAQRPTERDERTWSCFWALMR